MTTTKSTSKISPKKSYHHGDLRAELLSAAEIELSENGIEAFSLRAVAKRAGVSHGAPAHHFKNLTGLLTALAATGYERFIAAQNLRQQQAEADPESQLVASGLGYIDFAVDNPALFRLMFSSQQPDRANEDFAVAAMSAFDKLVADIQLLFESDPHTDPSTMRGVMASWAVVHGLANLMIAGRTERTLGLNQMSCTERDKVLTDILLRPIVGKAGN